MEPNWQETPNGHFFRVLLTRMGASKISSPGSPSCSLGEDRNVGVPCCFPGPAGPRWFQCPEGVGRWSFKRAPKHAGRSGEGGERHSQDPSGRSDSVSSEVRGGRGHRLPSALPADVGVSKTNGHRAPARPCALGQRG